METNPLRHIETVLGETDAQQTDTASRVMDIPSQKFKNYTKFNPITIEP